ncbi:MAG: 50S ribosomal protein L9 [Alphaproteobacteria bacterium]|nr:50S ribosomal protein L9 [Alphaproteobacteria bacterium]MBF0251838.1 50S ribosomal protein L9 [Alphaproteobacteria bacterium]
MEVILLERVEKLGQMGDIVKVKPGFARNYLLPREKALRATEANKKRFETQRAQLEAENLKRREEADAVAGKMTGLSVSLIRQAGEGGQLYGSVNARDIAASVTAAGFTIARSQVALQHPIKTLGLFEVRVSLHPEVSSSIIVNVARSEEEAAIQAETGHAMVGAEEEEQFQLETHDDEADDEAEALDAGDEETED